MAEIHNSAKRMPVILSRENENLWLQGNDTAEFKSPQIELIAKALKNINIKNSLTLNHSK